MDHSEHIRNVLIAAALTVMGGVLAASLTGYSAYVASHTIIPAIVASTAER